MKRRIPKFFLTDTGKIVVLAALICLLAIAGFMLGQLVYAYMLRADAISTAESWAESLERGVDDLPAILAGAKPSESSRRILSITSQVGDVYRCRIWNRSGQMIFKSERMPSASSAATLFDLRGSANARAILSGLEVTVSNAGDRSSNPQFYVVSFIPIRQGTSIAGAFEIYLDQTADKTIYERSCLITESLIAIAVLLAGGIPACLAYRTMIEHRAARAEALHLAEHDTLTGLANRTLLEERAAIALARAGREKGQVAAFMIDLDRFKEVNDAFGRSAGDSVIKELAQRLKYTIRTNDLAARIGGDEFVVLQEGVIQPGGAGELAERLQKVLSQPYQFGAMEIHCDVSIGIAVAPSDAADLDTLLTCADAAMYQVKADGRCGLRFFQSGMDAILRDRRRIEIDIRRALDAGLFQLAFQPLLECRGNRLIGFEALLRWPEGWAPQSPATFIPVAEESGLIVPLGMWVLETACSAAAAWKQPLRLAVNLSPVQFRHGDLVDAVEHALQVSGLEPHRLELEVTESIWMQNTDAVLDQLARLRKLGISIVLDDFGTGYSSLSYLWRFPFDKVKIDRSFVTDMQTEPKAAAIVKSVVALARTLHLSVTAEGVETRSQADRLVEAGCDQVQGFLFGRPLTSAQTIRLIDSELGEREKAPDYESIGAADVPAAL